MKSSCVNAISRHSKAAEQQPVESPASGTRFSRPAVPRFDCVPRRFGGSGRHPIPNRSSRVIPCMQGAHRLQVGAWSSHRWSCYQAWSTLSHGNFPLMHPISNDRFCRHPHAQSGPTTIVCPGGPAVRSCSKTRARSAAYGTRDRAKLTLTERPGCRARCKRSASPGIESCNEPHSRMDRRAIDKRPRWIPRPVASRGLACWWHGEIPVKRDIAGRFQERG